MVRLPALLASTPSLLALPWLLSLPATSVAAGAPNVVLVVLDDLGSADLGGYGGSLIATPNIDALAAAGMRFTRHYAAAPVCTPSRAAIATGRHPAALGVRSLIATTALTGVPTDVPSLAEVLGDVGYSTGHFGKWHLGESDPRFLPPARGFQHSVTQVERGRHWDVPMLVDGVEVATTGHAAEVVTDHALAFIRDQRDRPFFVNLWYHSPHLPYEAPDRWTAQYPDTRVGRYAAMVSHVDEQIGRIVAELRALGLERGTVVIVTSDNGGVLSVAPTNGSLRGYKGDLYEGGLRVPLVVCWPGTVAAGALNGSVGVGYDLFATVAELAGARPGPGLAGRSLRAALLDGALLPRPEPLVWEIKDASRRFDSPEGEFHRFAVRKGSWKLVWQNRATRLAPELFDLDADPGESRDLAGDRPELVAELLDDYGEWRRRVARISVARAESTGTTSVAGPWWSFSHGAIRLSPDDRLDVGDGDLSFEARLAAWSPGQGRQVIVRKSGSYELGLDESGRFELLVHGAAALGRTTLRSTSPVAPGQEVDVAFAIFDWRQDATTVRLYVDGRLEAESFEISSVELSPGEPVWLGNDASGGSPLRGRLWNPSFSAGFLARGEIADRDRDGVPNAVDACIDRPDGPLRPGAGGRVQADADGDGFGDACDADVNGDGVVGHAEIMAIGRAFGAVLGDADYAAELDLDSNGVIAYGDWVTAARALGQPPGPSGLSCAGACAGP
jgi:arylsulfatase A-like enzyme